jgi:hypothetical protein
MSRSNISHRLKLFEDSILMLYGESDTVTKALNGSTRQEVHTFGHLEAALMSYILSSAKMWHEKRLRMIEGFSFR